MKQCNSVVDNKTLVLLNLTTRNLVIYFKPDIIIYFYVLNEKMEFLGTNGYKEGM